MGATDRPLQRVERARQHLFELKDAIAAFKARDPFPIRLEADEKKGGLLFRVHVREQASDSTWFDLWRFHPQPAGLP